MNTTNCSHNVLADFQPAVDAVFASGKSVLIAKGVFTRITAPALDSDSSSSTLRKEIAAAFASARAAGITRPIVIGSLPFDASKPSALIVPLAHEWFDLEAIEGFCNNARSDSSQVTDIPIDAPGRDSFENAVRDLLPLFEQTSLRKVVLSRALDVPFEKPVDTRCVVRELLGNQETAFRFSIPITADEALVGRSPELLIRRNGLKIRSNPLAGTVARSRYATLADATGYLMDSEKDRLEHDMVAAEVHDVLSLYCDELEVPNAPSVLTTEALFHLSTVIEGSLRDLGTNALDLACALHPTPAVCGLPRQAARMQIAEKESFDRGFFTGTTGWMNAEGDGEWAVTIRCGLLSQNRMRLFAGAGIVPGSIPEREWDETSAKLMPMMRTITNAQRDT